MLPSERTVVGFSTGWNMRTKICGCGLVPALGEDGEGSGCAYEDDAVYSARLYKQSKDSQDACLGSPVRAQVFLQTTPVEPTCMPLLS